MKKSLLVICTILASTQLQAQFIKEKAIDVSVGFGMSAAYDEVDFYGTGFYAQGEYVLSASKWIDFRPYAGFLFTKMNENDNYVREAGYQSTSTALLFGGKTRITAPIPWVAPYVEVGVGASVGSFKTSTPYTNVNESGVFTHIPFTLGLELGPEHNVNFEFTYYFHNRVEQFGGAAAIGLSFPVGN